MFSVESLGFQFSSFQDDRSAGGSLILRYGMLSKGTACSVLLEVDSTWWKGRVRSINNNEEYNIDYENGTVINFRAQPPFNTHNR